MSSSTQTTPTKQSKSTQAAKAKNKAVNSPATAKTTTTLPNALPYDVIGMLRLKQCKRKETDRILGVALSDADLQAISVLGIKYQVTAGELVKGLIDRELADVNGGSNLSHFIPVLQF